MGFKDDALETKVVTTELNVGHLEQYSPAGTNELY